MRVRKKKLEIPEECPFLKTCEVEVLESTYRGICTSKHWVTCEFATKEARKYALKPREWKMLEKLKGKKYEET